MTRDIDITGEKYGRLTIIEKIPPNEVIKKSRWICRCDCGKEKILMAAEIKSGNTISCGCLRRENFLKFNLKHGRCGTPEHKTWVNMTIRCKHSTATGYQNYGGRGIKVCERWNDFTNFYEDMGDKPSPNHSIDRIDVNGGYSPDNCRWATKMEQSRNKRIRKTNTTGVTGVIATKFGTWRSHITVDKKKSYLGSFKTFEEALDARKFAEIKYWGSTVE